MHSSPVILHRLTWLLRLTLPSLHVRSIDVTCFMYDIALKYWCPYSLVSTHTQYLVFSFVPHATSQLRPDFHFTKSFSWYPTTHYFPQHTDPLSYCTSNFRIIPSFTPLVSFSNTVFSPLPQHVHLLWHCRHTHLPTVYTNAALHSWAALFWPAGFHSMLAWLLFYFPTRVLFCLLHQVLLLLSTYSHTFIVQWWVFSSTYTPYTHSVILLYATSFL
jgi:hypothetical protein